MCGRGSNGDWICTMVWLRSSAAVSSQACMATKSNLRKIRPIGEIEESHRLKDEDIVGPTCLDLFLFEVYTIKISIRLKIIIIII